MVGGVLTSKFSNLDVLLSTAVFILVLSVLDCKTKSTSYSSVKHLLKTKSKINKKFKKKNKQHKKYHEIFYLPLTHFLTLLQASS